MGIDHIRKTYDSFLFHSLLTSRRDMSCPYERYNYEIQTRITQCNHGFCMHVVRHVLCGGKYEIAVVAKVTGIPWFNRMETGVNEAAKTGCECLPDRTFNAGPGAAGESD